jgi:hypothetical protein
LPRKQLRGFTSGLPALVEERQPDLVVQLQAISAQPVDSAHWVLRFDPPWQMDFEPFRPYRRCVAPRRKSNVEKMLLQFFAAWRLCQVVLLDLLGTGVALTASGGKDELGQVKQKSGQ